MSARCRSLSWFGVFATLCWSGLLPVTASGQRLPKTEKIQIIESKDSELATNLIQSAAPKDRSRQLEDLLTKPLQGMSTKGGSLDPVMLPACRLPGRLFKVPVPKLCWTNARTGT